MKYKNNYSITEQNEEKQSGCKIIPFPGIKFNTSERYRPSFLASAPECRVINGKPEIKLPENIPDFRPYLQRNGLILLSWDKRWCEKGALYTAYWVTSSGINRYYASPANYLEDFKETMPYRKSYAAEDGIDYYGEAGPVYMVHVAPELMMSSRHKKLQRPEHIRRLKDLGVNVDFNYPFLLSKEKKRFFSGSRKGA